MPKPTKNPQLPSVWKSINIRFREDDSFDIWISSETATGSSDGPFRSSKVSTKAALKAELISYINCIGKPAT